MTRELWLVMILKCIESISYFSTSVNVTIYVTKMFNISDEEAGMYYGLWGTCIGIASCVSGRLVDRMGVPKSLAFGAIASALGRTIFSTTTHKTIALFSLLFLESIGCVLSIPVLTIALKRVCHTPADRSFYFGVFYVVMNIGAFVADVSTDFFRLQLGGNGPDSDLRGIERLLQATAMLSWIYMSVVIISIRNGYFCEDSLLSKEHDDRSLYSRFIDAWKNLGFRKIVIFSFVLFGVQTIFRHLETTFPKYLLRTAGDHAYYGLLIALNTLLVIVLVPLFQYGFGQYHYDMYNVISVGACISASSPLILYFFPPSIHTYTSTVAFITVFSIGESIYSPKTTEYIMAMAPVGEEGSYGALAQIPMFTMKFFSGFIGGHLLGHFCPSTTQCSSVLWLIIGLIAMSTPIALVGSRKWLYDHHAKVLLASTDEIELTDG